MEATKELLAAARVGDAARVARALRHGADANAADWMQQTPLFLAAKDGHVGAARALLEAGARCDARDKYGSTPLTLAAEKGFIELVELLLAHQGDANHASHDGDTLLMTAALRGHTRVVVALLDAGADVDAANRWGATALHVAALHGHSDTVRALLEAGANSDQQNATGKTALDEAERKHHSAVAQLLRQFDGAGAMFLQSVRRGDVDAVRRGLSRTPLSIRGPHERTPVHIAAKYGRLDVLRLLLSRGASLTDRDDTLWTALHHACEHGSVDVVRFLLSQRADTSGVDAHGRTPVDIAALNGRLEVVRELCRAGVSVQSISFDDRTILHRAVTSKNVSLIDYLVDQHVLLDAPDVCGWTPLHQAIHAGLAPVVTKLLARGADANRLTTASRTDKSVRECDSPLHLAIRADHMHILSLLLAHPGIDLEVGNHVGRTPLIFAASLDRVQAAAMLVAAGANVNAQGDAGESALLAASVRGTTQIVLDLLQAGARTDLVAKSGRTPLTAAKSDELRSVIQMYHNSQHFHDQCFAYLAGGEPPTITKLQPLVPLLTSVYDLRHVLTLVALCEDDSSGSSKGLLTAAFHHVVDHKLTFDDDACVFFKLCLERCERDKRLPREELLLLDRKAEKVNTESADWVVEMKKQVSSNSWRLDTHDEQLHAVVHGLKQVHTMVVENRKVLIQVTRRVGGLERQVKEGHRMLQQLRNSVGRMVNDVGRFESRLSASEANIETVAANLRGFREAYVDRLQQEERNAKIKRVCGIVASVAGFVFAPVLKEVADAVVDFVNPIDIVEKLYGETNIAEFLSEKSDKALPELITSQLEKYAIPEDEFETLLREEIVLRHPEYVEECTRRGWSVNVDGGRSDIARSAQPALDAEEEALEKIVSELQSLCATSVGEMTITKTSATTSNYASSAKPPEFVSPSRAREEARTAIAGSAVKSRVEQTSKMQQQATTTAAASAKRDETNPPARLESHGSSSSVDSLVASGESGELVFVDDLDDFHFHAAVQESRGNVSELTELVEMIDTAECDPHAKMTLQLCTVTTSQESLCAAAYAYRLGYHEVGNFLMSHMKSSSAFDTTPAKSVELLEDAEEFPFVYAVEECEGDVEECKHLVLSLFELMNQDDGALDATVSATITREQKETVQWTALEYACHLGYVDVVKCLLKDIYKDSIPLKMKFQLLKAVRERSLQSLSS